MAVDPEYNSVTQEESAPLNDDDRPLRHVRREPIITWKVVSFLLSLVTIGTIAVLVRYTRTKCASPSIPLSPQKPTFPSFTVHHNGNITTSTDVWNPFDLSQALVEPPSIPSIRETASTRQVGYLIQPNIVNDTLVIISEGDLFLTRLSRDKLPAMKLTTTVGNVRDPKINPWAQHLIAYTATYTAHREIYLYNLSSSLPSTRLTYTPGSISAVVGWKNAHTLVFASMSMAAASLPDKRLYTLDLNTRVIAPIPLAQATEGSYHANGCLYFTRYQQGSHTIRYVGGTAESLWKWCEDEMKATHLTSDYNGTSKAPTVIDDILYFLSDREWKNGYWRPTTMNLWAWNLTELRPTRLTAISCQYQGRSLREYSIDPITRNVVLRIGADVYLLTSHQIQNTIQGGTIGKPELLEVAIYSDFHEQQERIIPIKIVKHFEALDVKDSMALLTVRGQVVAVPILDHVPDVDYQGAGQNLPMRRYRVAPGTRTAGAMRVLKTLNVPRSSQILLLATDPLSPTAEHAYYLVDLLPNVNLFNDFDHFPEPILGGHMNGGSTRDGGLGSIHADSVVISPCGRRLAWADTDGRICVMTLTNQTAMYQVLPPENELGEPMDGTEVDLQWSPAGRYLAVNHHARNQFAIISIIDCGDAMNGEIKFGRMMQATPSRFNVYDMYWGITTLDAVMLQRNKLLAQLSHTAEPSLIVTTLYFLTDRDISTDVSSPWGTRAPGPHFEMEALLYALPLLEEKNKMAMYSGGGALEVYAAYFAELKEELELAAQQANTSIPTRRRASSKALSNDRLRARLLDDLSTEPSRSEDFTPTAAPSNKSTLDEERLPQDPEINFGGVNLDFARRAYRVANIPKSKYLSILSQTMDDSSLVVLETVENIPVLTVFVPEDYPSDRFEKIQILAARRVSGWGVSTDRENLYLVFSDGKTKVIKNTLSSLSRLITDENFEESLLDLDDFAISVWPSLEYEQMYNDAWRLLRDYFYDPSMAGVDWSTIHGRYQNQVSRCAKREDLDDVLAQMASELSALHVFVYGGEYSTPFEGQSLLARLHEPASLGVGLVRSVEWKGYMVTEMPEIDPDFNLIDGEAVYCPVSWRTLSPSGQKGLEAGDVIVGVNGESVLQVPDIHMLLRGSAGRTVRLEVLRLASGSDKRLEEVQTEPLVVVPITMSGALNLRYDAWEHATREKAKQWASEAGFTVGYIHLRAMENEDMDAFARYYFPDYDAQALVLDLRHNSGGNIDSWIISFLQRKAWMYWGGRTERKRSGNMDWDEQFAFRGHLVVLIDEMTSSDGEGLARGISELGLGRLVGARTWGGGIWLSSDNKLVDGGIATAPEVGTYNQKHGWGMGIEQHGVVPDVEVDNEPRTTYEGQDAQLRRAIEELARWLKDDPVAYPNFLSSDRPDMSLHDEDCTV